MGIDVLGIDRFGRTESLPAFKSQARFRSVWLDRVRAWVEYGDWEERVLRTEHKINCFCMALVSFFIICMLSIIIKAIL